MAYTKVDEREAFCTCCPSAEEVGSLLQVLGFELTFHMDTDAPPMYEQMPPLPAQFHFQDTHVMYNQKSSPSPPFPPWS
jgi:hypothetical protein